MDILSPSSHHQPHGDTMLHSSHPPRSTLRCSNLGVTEGIREMLSLAPEHSFCQFQWHKCCHFPERLIGVLRLQTPLKTNFQLFPTVRKLPSVCLDLCHYFQLQPLSVQIYWLHDQHQPVLIRLSSICWHLLLALTPNKQCIDGNYVSSSLPFGSTCRTQKVFLQRLKGQSSLLLPEVTSEKDKISPWKLDSGLGLIARACCSPPEHKQFHGRSVSYKRPLTGQNMNIIQITKMTKYHPILTNLSDCCLSLLYSSYSVDMIY